MRKNSGRKCSLTTRKKISCALMGHKVTAKTRKKISKSHMDKTRSVSHRKNISRALTGRPVSQETRAKIGFASQGEKARHAKLTEKEVMDIKYIYQEHLKQRRADGFQRCAKGFVADLSYYYGVRAPHIVYIGQGRKWKHLK